MFPPGNTVSSVAASPPCTAASSASGGRHIKATDPPSAKRARKSFQLDARRMLKAHTLHYATLCRIGLALLSSKNNLFPRTLMEDITAWQEDDDIRDVVASSSVRPRAAKWRSVSPGSSNANSSAIAHSARVRKESRSDISSMEVIERAMSEGRAAPGDNLRTAAQMEGLEESCCWSSQRTRWWLSWGGER